MSKIIQPQGKAIARIEMTMDAKGQTQVITQDLTPQARLMFTGPGFPPLALLTAAGMLSAVLNSVIVGIMQGAVPRKKEGDDGDEKTT